MWTRLDEIEDLSIFERLMRLNYLGSVYPTFHALPHLKRAQGRIVAVASMAGLIGVPTRTGYSAAKHAVSDSSIRCVSSCSTAASASA
jgi:NAD(P)-dependent dehydrogenase (short-subunit alcohol dehydrogenase family)